MQTVELKNKTILVTGAAGFIGSNLVMELLRTVESVTIIGLDNMNDYYDVSIKEYRLAEINKLAADYIAKRVLTQPLYADLSLENVDRICGIILEKNQVTERICEYV